MKILHGTADPKNVNELFMNGENSPEILNMIIIIIAQMILIPLWRAAILFSKLVNFYLAHALYAQYVPPPTKSEKATANHPAIPR